MAWGTAPLFRLIDEPYYRRFVSNAPPDDWEWKEGRPTPLASPVLPHNVHPIMYARIYGKPVVEPKYSLSHLGVPIRSTGPFPFKWTSYVPINRPSFISDHHMVAIRNQVETLWSPKFYAHIHLDVQGELIVSPLMAIVHGLVAEAQTMGWNAFGDVTNHRIYSFGHGGIMSGGHVHVWGAGAHDGGSVQWTGRLILTQPHGGTIGPLQGNYEILEVRWSYTLTKWFRTVYSQDSLRHFTHDLDARTQWWQKAFPRTFLWDEVMGYLLDAGTLWLCPGNTRPCPTCPDGIAILADRQHTYAYSCSTIVDRENVLRPWFGCGRTHVPLEGPKNAEVMKLGHHWFDEREKNRWIDKGITYWSEKKIFSGEGYSFSTGSIYGDVGNDPPPGECAAYAGDKWVTNVIGTRLVPTWYVKVRSLNGRITTHVITDTEFPNAS